LLSPVVVAVKVALVVAVVPVVIARMLGGKTLVAGFLLKLL
jgi:hypothetical protein